MSDNHIGVKIDGVVYVRLDKVEETTDALRDEIERLHDELDQAMRDLRLWRSALAEQEQK